MFNINNKFYRLVPALLMIGGMLFFCPHASAKSLVAQELIQMGKELYENGSHEEALHEFSKVLLIEPRNEEALSYLEKMGFDDGIYGRRKSPLFDLYALNVEIVEYQQQIDQLNREQQKDYEKIDALQERIVQKENEKQQLIDENYELNAVATMKLKEQQEYIENLKQENELKKEELLRLNTDLAELKQELVADKTTLAQMTADLEGLEREYDQYQQMTEDEKQAMTNDYKKSLADLEEQRDHLEREIFKVKDRYRRNMRKYHDALVIKEADLKKEKNLSAVKSYRIAQQENRFLALKEELDNVKDQKEMLKDEAYLLQEEIRALKRKLTFRYVEMSGRESSEDLEDHIRQQDEKLIQLKEQQIALLNKIEFLKEQGNEEDKQMIRDLNRQIDGLKKEIKQKEEEIEFQGKQQEALNGRIDEYQKRLDIVEGMIEDKEARILFLEEQLGADIYPDEG